MEEFSVKVKICGLRRAEDIEMVNRFQPDYAGFVFAPGKRQVTAGQACALRDRLRKEICPVGVFVDAPEEEICSLVRQSVIGAVQLHGHETPEAVGRLKELLAPFAVPVIKALRVEGTLFLGTWEESSADFLLLDSGGGTGKPFDHGLIGRIRKPWFLAGGMNPDNAGEAVRRFHPYGIDVSSGVETDGKKDAGKVEQMIRRVREASRMVMPDGRG